METGIRFGGDVTKDTANNLASLIERVFKAAHANHMEQNTVCEALRVVGNATSTNNATVSNCVINGEKTVNT